MARLGVALALSVLVAATVAQQCPGDTTGCWMCPNSALMNCINTAVAGTEACKTLPADQQPPCLCRAFQAQADCWAAGLYCKEWIPLQRDADKMCALAAQVPTGSGLPGPLESALSSVATEQASASNSIWHNDSGTDIPVVSDNVNPTTRSETATHRTTGPAPLAYTAGTVSITTPNFAMATSTSSETSAAVAPNAATSSSSLANAVTPTASSATFIVNAAPQSSADVAAVIRNSGASAQMGQLICATVMGAAVLVLLTMR